MTLSRGAKAVSPVRGAYRALMRSEDSRHLTANLRWLWNVFMVNPRGEVKAKFWPDAKGRLPQRRGMDCG